MERKAVTGMMLTLLITSMLTLAFNIQPVKASGTIYMRADGSVSPQQRLFRARAQSSWTKRIIDNTTYDPLMGGPSGIAVADIDGAGPLDVFAGAWSNGLIKWYKATANDPITEPWTDYLIERCYCAPQGIFVYDIDNDGDRDLFVAGSDILWYEHPSDPTSVPWTKYKIDDDPSDPRDVFVADINGDAHPDVVAVPGNLGAELVWYESPANPKQHNWSKHIIDTITDIHPGYNYDARNLFVSDIDGDNHMDVVTGHFTSGTSQIYWYKAGTDITLPWTRYTIGQVYQAWDFYLHDIDWDTHPDVVVTGNGELVWFEAPNIPTTGTWTKHTIGTPSEARAVDLHDMDGDEDPDVVVGAQGSSKVFWYEAPVDPITGSWAQHEIGVVQGPWFIDVGDIDVDGDPDVVATAFSGGEVVWFENVPAIPAKIAATVDIDPDTLNLKSKGEWITCYIELPEGYNVSDIDVSTILLNNTVPAKWSDIQDNVLMVKFNRTSVISLLDLGNQTIKITGQLTDGTPFEGTDTIRAIHAQITLTDLRTIHLNITGAFLQGENLELNFYSYSGAYQGETTVWSGTTPAQIDLSLDLPQNSPIENAILILTDNEENTILNLVNFVVHRSDLFTRIAQIDIEWAYASPSERTAMFQEIIDIDMQWPYAPP